MPGEPCEELGVFACRCTRAEGTMAATQCSLLLCVIQQASVDTITLFEINKATAKGVLAIVQPCDPRECRTTNELGGSSSFKICIGEFLVYRLIQG